MGGPRGTSEQNFQANLVAPRRSGYVYRLGTNRLSLISMPTYEFRCPEGHEFEKFYRTIGTAEAVVACPTCGLIAERMMSATGFAFKGSGFYLTDYGKNAHRGTDPAADPRHRTGGVRPLALHRVEVVGPDVVKNRAPRHVPREPVPGVAPVEVIT